MTLQTYGYIVGAALVIFLVGYGVGRYATPPKVEQKIVEVEKEHTDTKSKTITTVTEKPDGTKVTIINNDTNTVTQDDKNTTTVTKTALPDWRLAFGMGYNFSENTQTYGLDVDRRILGPIFLRVGGSSGATLQGREVHVLVGYEF